MKEYFVLQFKMLNRQLTEWGIEPIIGYLIGIFAFVGISIKLFEKTQFAEYIHITLALSLVLKLNEINRNEFLKLCYSKTEYIKIRIVENLIVSIVFILFLLFEEKYLSSILLFILATLFSLIDLKTKSSFTLPTPFYKHPFEFTVGFRSNYFIYFFAYFLTFVSISVDNFNLGIFSLILTLLCCLNYYTNSENEFYVWVFSLTPKEFLKYKLRYIIQYSTILSLPILISLSLFFYTKIDLIIGFQFLGYLFIFTTMLAKYSVFPEKLNIKFGIILALTFWFPPLLVLIIPYLYIQSTKKLKEIL
ncbi:ABC transporter permease [Flavobacterium sp. 25HG05S-40]|uniref:ABC transporter permease n=1 Tax=Flavobacterium sp. 25HG05S-40 TaxID=3458682 RepID=UPI004045199F